MDRDERIAQLESLLAERDGVIAELKLKIEYDQRIRNHTIPGHEEAMLEVMRERNEAVKEIERLRRAIRGCYDEALQTRQKTQKQAEMVHSEYLAALKLQPVGQFPILLDVLYGEIENKLVQGFNEFDTDLQVVVGSNPDPNIFWGYYLSTAFELRRLNGLNDYAVAIIQRAYDLAKDPRLIAYDVLLELQYTGEISLESLERLSLDWIKQNISDELGTYPTLKQALEIEEQRRKKGKKIVDLYIETGTPERTLQGYKRWYGNFERISQDAPEWAITQLKSMIQTILSTK